MAGAGGAAYNDRMRTSRHRTVQAVAGTLRRRDLIPAGSHVVVALSGGADSVALAAILRELARGNRHRFDLVLAHLNHGLRRTASRDAAFVADLAGRWALPLVTARARVREAARERGVGIEEAARSVRYEFLERTALDAGASHVALGHHSDDQAETVLMSFLRGASVRGLAGMPVRRPIRPGSPVVLVRPLIEVSRAELIDYLKARRLTWVEDETNRSRKMMRNRVRHDLLPMLERDYAPGLRRRLVQGAAALADVQERLAGRAAAVWDDAVVSATRTAVTFRIDLLRDEGRAVTAELLLAALERLGAGRGDITAEHLSAVWQVVTSPAGGQQLDLPGRVRVSRRGKHLRVGVAE